MFHIFMGVVMAVWIIFSLTLATAALLCCIPVALFSQKKMYAGTHLVADIWVRHVHLILHHVYKVEIRLTGAEEIIPGENALIIANHQSACDFIPLIEMMALGEACGKVNFFAKDILKYAIPFGSAIYLVGFIMVKRDAARDIGKLKKAFTKITQYQIPIWMFIFAEGTRRTSEKQRQHVKKADARGVPALTNVLLPKKTGFVASVQKLEHHFDTVYDVTIGYPEKVPTLSDLFFGKVTRVDMHISRFEIERFRGIQEDSLESWLNERWRLKDDLLARYKRNKTF